ncbi:hypothetical protein GNI_081800 [Gregarina niphandrodes]|uniref:Uncharacterized protein n=1 Tax=Gregarina niphandrodes TaxID=110365 RepID=A0A023B668_GRENI|nr:hypothetical protein GNI_081800 [Gregarina niphandrodes]EZG65879.1 hypothetical protein GNI_081800 [Gregarina niphandrodes]|eukprot:XP_011134037.1 hypothetical protein GNI_081800 [Gregarina niphandrodes]
MKKQILFATGVAALGERDTNQFYSLTCGRVPWDPDAVPDLSTRYPFGADGETCTTPADYLLQTAPFYDGEQTGFWADCERAFAFDVCEDYMKPVCDSFCKDACLSHCREPFATFQALQTCVNSHGLNSCAYRYGLVNFISIKSACQ